MTNQATKSINITKQTQHHHKYTSMEPLDLALAQEIITPDEHKQFIRLRWLHNIIFGSNHISSCLNFASSASAFFTQSDHEHHNAAQYNHNIKTDKDIALIEKEYDIARKAVSHYGHWNLVMDLAVYHKPLKTSMRMLSATTQKANYIENQEKEHLQEAALILKVIYKQFRAHHHSTKQNTKSFDQECKMAGVGGFEPPIMIPKTIALPLGYTPTLEMNSEIYNA